jgi:hypothetical protein
MEKKINYNRDTRKILVDLYTLLDKVSIYHTYKNSDINIYDSILYSLKFLINNDIKPIYILYSTMYMTLYSDLYLKLKKKEDNNVLSANEKLIFYVLNNIRNYNDLPRLFENKNIFYLAFDATREFYSSSVFEKISLVKSEDLKTYQKISNINTIHYQDKENYDIDVSLDFIINKMNVALKHNSIDKAYLEAGKFIKDLIDINDESASNIINTLIKTDIKVLNYYLNNDKIEENYSDEEIDKQLRMKERFQKYKNLFIEKIVQDLRVSDISDLLENYLEYINYDEEKRNEIENLSVDSQIEKKLLTLK